MTASIPPLAPRGDLRARVLAGEPTIGAFVTFGNTISAELIGLVGFDWLIVDLETATGPRRTSCPSSMPSSSRRPRARPRHLERAPAHRPDAGHGRRRVMIPRLETAAEAREAMSWLRLPPAGIRGIAMGTRGAGIGEVGHADVAAISERVLGVFQVESPLAVGAARENAAIDGVDVLFVGPADLSHGWGCPVRYHRARIPRGARRARAARPGARQAAGILLRTADDVPEHLVRGFTFIGIGADWGYMTSAARADLKAARDAVATDRPRQSSARRTVGWGRGASARRLGPAAGLRDDHPREDEGAADELDRRQMLVQQQRGQGDRPDRLDRRRGRYLGGADALRPRVERIDGYERRDRPNADGAPAMPRSGSGRAGPAGRPPAPQATAPSPSRSSSAASRPSPPAARIAVRRPHVDRPSPDKRADRMIRAA